MKDIILLVVSGLTLLVAYKSIKTYHVFINSSKATSHLYSLVLASGILIFLNSLAGIILKFI